MKYYYTNKNNEAAGPATIDDIRALATAGEIAADPMVAPEGGNTWRALSSIDATPNATATPDATATLDATAATTIETAGVATIMSDAVEKIVSCAAALLSPARIGCVMRCSRLYGHYALLAGTVLTLLYSIFIAIRFGSIGPFLSGIGCVLALVVGQFVAVQFLAAADRLVAATPSRLSSNAVMKCVSLISIVFTVCLFAGGIVTMVGSGSVWPFLFATAGAVVAALFAGVALHPSVTNVGIGQGSAGEEAVGIIMVFLKIHLKILPLVFAIPAIFGCLVTLVSFFTRSSNVNGMRHLLSDEMRYLLSNEIPALFDMGGAPLLLWACIIPLVTYLMFLFVTLLLDVLRAILVLPSKIDQWRR
jgi:hypothetical protein